MSFEEILCLDEEPEIDPENIFAGHDRDFIIRGILTGRIRTDLTNVFYQFSPSERMRILMAIRDGTLDVPVTEDFLAVLTSGEKKLLESRFGS